MTEERRLVDESWTGDASPLDANGDGWPDLYVLNMQGHDEYYENVGGEYFERRSRELFPRTPWGAMSIKVFDFDNDADMDIILTDMHSDMSEDIGPDREKLKSRMQWSETTLQSGGTSIFGNAFFRNEGDGTFTEASDALGTENYWPWGLSVGDLNADGFEDVFIASSMNFPFRYGVNSVLLNDRGERFLDSEFLLGVEPRRDRRTARPWFTLDCLAADRGNSYCEEFGLLGRTVVWGAVGSRSAAIFDLEGDGDLDIVTNEFHDGPMVLVSDLSERTPVRYLAVRLVGTESNRDGLGASVTVRAGGRSYVKVHDGQSGYLSQSSMPLYFGLADADQVEEIVVAWPSGRRQVVTGPDRRQHHGRRPGGVTAAAAGSPHSSSRPLTTMASSSNRVLMSAPGPSAVMNSTTPSPRVIGSVFGNWNVTRIAPSANTRMSPGTMGARPRRASIVAARIRSFISPSPSNDGGRPTTVRP